MNNKKTIKVGHCPRCGSSALLYHDHEFYADEVSFPYTCQDCGQYGAEQYRVEFICHIANDEEFYEGQDLIKKKGK